MLLRLSVIISYLLHSKSDWWKIDVETVLEMFRRFEELFGDEDAKTIEVILDLIFNVKKSARVAHVKKKNDQ